MLCRLVASALAGQKAGASVAQRHARGFPVESPRELISREPVVHGSQSPALFRLRIRSHLIVILINSMPLLRPQHLCHLAR
eukprot:3813567-Pyramimonas_sp.AAC.1